MGVTLVVSTHLDDAVFSVGQLLAASPGTIVVTVFAGIPDGDAADGYDRACGFANSAQAMRHRRGEDESALAMLGATPVHLDLFGMQYRAHTEDEVAGALDQAVSRIGPDRVVGPIGLVHPDHELVGRLWPRILLRHAGVERYAYEDLPYRATFPRKSQRAISAFARRHHANDARLPSGEAGAKACAMLAYSSQLRTATPLRCLEPERVWRLDAVREDP